MMRLKDQLLNHIQMILGIEFERELIECLLKGMHQIKLIPSLRLLEQELLSCHVPCGNLVDFMLICVLSNDSIYCDSQ